MREIRMSGSLTAVAPMAAPASIASPSAIDRFMAFSFELFVNLICPHALTSRARPTCEADSQYFSGCPAVVGGDRGLGLPSSGRPRNKTLALHTIPVPICFSYDLSRGRRADAGRAYYAALFQYRLHFT